MLAVYITNPNEFDIQNALLKVMKTYNNTIHSTMNYTPNVVFYWNSKDLFNEVKNNIIERFIYIRNLAYNFNINENWLLYNNNC